MKYFLVLIFVSMQIYASNKDTVRQFYHLAFNQHKPKEAANRYIGETYKQHNPFAPDGKKAFIQFFEKYYQTHTEAFVQIKRLIEEDDTVVVHAHSKQSKDDLGHAVVDIFKLKDNRIIEHWDVMQKVPKHSANTNTMF